MQNNRRWIGAGWVLVFLFLFAPRLEAGHFQVYSLKVEGTVQDLVIADLDEDGRKDLVAFCRSGNRRAYHRFLTIFWQGPESSFNLKQATVLKLPPEVIQVDFGQVDGKPGLEVAAVTGRGIFYYPNQDRGFGPWTELIAGASLFAKPRPDFLDYYDFLSDWDGDGREEILLYQFDQAKLYRRGDGAAFQEEQTLRLPIEIDLGPPNPIRYVRPHPSFRVAYWSPQLDLLDFNADGRPDLIATNSDQAAVFLQNAQGGFPEKPSSSFFFDLLQEEERDFRRDRQGMSILNVVDLDGDGRADLLANTQEGNLANRKSTVRIYWGRTDSWEKAKPDATLALDKAAVGPLIRDVDGDGDQDLVMLIFDIGVYTAAKVLLTGTFNLIWQYYLLGPDQTYPAQPTYVDTTPVKVDISKLRLIGGMPNLFADFNGDGKDDVLYGKSDNELVVALKDAQGRRTGVEEVVSVPVGMIPIAEDLNGDKKGEVILWYPWDKERKDLITVLINLGGW